MANGWSIHNTRQHGKGNGTEESASRGKIKSKQRTESTCGRDSSKQGGAMGEGKRGLSLGRGGDIGGMTAGKNHVQKKKTHLLHQCLAKGFY